MYDPKNTEEKINKFWKKEKIFQKSVEKSSPKGDFIFMMALHLLLDCHIMELYYQVL